MNLAPKDHMYYTLRDMGMRLLVEFQFDVRRKFRFDFALPDHRVAIEYEGIFNPRAGKSRHTTLSGYSTDTEKYNLAAVNGWRVLRYTAKNYKDLRSDLMKLLFNTTLTLNEREGKSIDSDRRIHKSAGVATEIRPAGS